jgi:signal transduction histidine kinase
MSYTRTYTGSGLGLVICKSLCELMNGKIWVESERGKGSNFIFSIPFTSYSDMKKEENTPIFTTDSNFMDYKATYE